MITDYVMPHLTGKNIAWRKFGSALSMQALEKDVQTRAVGVIQGFQNEETNYPGIGALGINSNS